MTQEEKLAKVRAFLDRNDLSGTDLNLKTQALEMDEKLATARADYQQLSKQIEQQNAALNKKQVEVISLSSRLDGLCDLIVSLDVQGSVDVEVVEE